MLQYAASATRKKTSLRNILKNLTGDYKILLKYRSLIRFIVAGKSKSELFKTFLGEGWYIIAPLSRMLIYYFLIIVIFKSGESYGVSPFLLMVFGLTHYLLFQESISSASGSIISSQSILMQLKIEPLIFVAVSYLRIVRRFFFSLGLYVFFHILISPGLSTNLLFYPIILSVLALLSWSFSIIVASFSVFLADLGQLSEILLNILRYLAPVIYTVSFFPEKFRALLLYNPVACIFALLQWSVFSTELPSLGNIIFMLAFTVVIFLWAHTVYANCKVKFTKEF